MEGDELQGAAESLGLSRGECHQDQAGTLGKHELRERAWLASCYGLTLTQLTFKQAQRPCK